MAVKRISKGIIGYGGLLSIVGVLLSVTVSAYDGALPVRLTPDWSRDKFVRYEGDPIRIAVEVQEECFVTVWAMDGTGAIRVLWPHHTSYCNHLWPGERRMIEFGEELTAAHPGPVFIFAFGDRNVRSRFHYQDEQVPILARGPYARRGNEELFLTQREQQFPLAIGYRVKRDVRTVTASQARQLAEELESFVYNDYERFVPIVDRFLDWMDQATSRYPGRDYGSSIVDLYVAPWRYSPKSYRVIAGRYQPPTQREYRRVHFDPFTNYGSWITIGSMQVWQPDVDQSWRPFMHGCWAWTRYGWTWFSYEPWGDITDHYGFWSWHPRFRWVWVPSDVWKPAPVFWLAYREHVVWYPEIPPPNLVRALGREFTYGRDVPGANMVARRYFASENLADFLIPPKQVADMTAKSRDGSMQLTSGPDRAVIERELGKRIASVDLTEGARVKIDTLNREFAPKMASESSGAAARIKNLINTRQQAMGGASSASPAEPKPQVPQTKLEPRKQEPKGKRYGMPSFDTAAYEAEQKEAEQEEAKE